MSMLRRNHVMRRRLLHWRPREGGSLVCLAHAGFGVHAFDGDDASQGIVAGRLNQFRLAGLRS
jgi:hypothetical protein